MQLNFASPSSNFFIFFAWFKIISLAISREDIGESILPWVQSCYSVGNGVWLFTPIPLPIMDVFEWWDDWFVILVENWIWVHLIQLPLSIVLSMCISLPGPEVSRQIVTLLSTLRWEFFLIRSAQRHLTWCVQILIKLVAFKFFRFKRAIIAIMKLYLIFDISESDQSFWNSRILYHLYLF